ncbi:BrnT family toxin [Bdellovibrio bacteriovorus]|uniref:BrnT family toxin n=1 Tax=Bdellovibrio bacteriovorus TaxID=959 RepID=A0A1Z3N559_BDEBC|nr:BrnT family toxin [Bdellovibrio bacteriovorus]ASD62541.1 hypothetical protein B9G79_02630 [Bdellovibrio bacteriovorus]
MEFEWDDDKAQSNYKKHGVRFSEAVTTFRDSHALEMLDQESSANEDGKKGNIPGNGIISTRFA